MIEDIYLSSGILGSENISSNISDATYLNASITNSDMYTNGLVFDSVNIFGGIDDDSVDVMSTISDAVYLESDL